MRRILVTGGLVAAQAAALVATSRVPGLGVEGWHHVASLGAALALAAALGRPLTRSRRFLAIGVLATAVAATVSGFWLLYWKEGIRAAGYQDWGVFWHVAWSWLAAIFFFQHTWINRVSLAHFLRRSLATPAARGVHGAAYLVVVLAFLVTWSGLGKGWFTVENYIPLSLYAWLVAVPPPYATWMLLSARARGAGHEAAERLQASRTRLRGVVDVALVPIAALAVASGVALTWWDPWMDANGWKYVSKYWHVWPSVVFAVLVFAHTVQLWGPVRAHWRGYGSSRPPRPRRVAATPLTPGPTGTSRPDP